MDYYELISMKSNLHAERNILFFRYVLYSLNELGNADKLLKEDGVMISAQLLCILMLRLFTQTGFEFTRNTHR